MLKLISWNVNGIRAIAKKGFIEQIRELNADIICLQETKALEEQVREVLQDLTEYRIYSNSAVKKGYSGTAVLCREEPLTIKHDIGIEEHDREGRVILTEFSDFKLVNVYTPNSGSELKRLSYRRQWDRDFLEYLGKLGNNKPLLVSGDLNVARRDIDLARPKQNYNKHAGYMQAEIDGIDNLLSSGLVDTFRHRHPDTVKYSWWSYRAGARARNVGWRIDYFLSSQALMPHVKKAEVLDQVMGSDHCPVSLELD